MIKYFLFEITDLVVRKSALYKFDKMNLQSIQTVFQVLSLNYACHLPVHVAHLLVSNHEEEDLHCLQPRKIHTPINRSITTAKKTLWPKL